MDFQEPDWEAPLDVDAYLDLIPPGETIKGLFLAGVAERAASEGKPLPSARERYVKFQDYPLREQAQLLIEAAHASSPKYSVRRALRWIGHGALDVWKTTTVGRVALASATDAERLIEMFAKMYPIVYPSAVITIVETTPRAATVRVENVYSFLDSHHVGVLEGAFREINIKPIVKVRMRTLIDGDMRFEY